MTDNHTESNVNIFRPMLDVYKKDIYLFAQKYNIPYVYDSTPSWSERGQKRDKLIPFLNNFDERILPGLINLSEYLISTNKIYRSSIDNLVIFYHSNANIICTISRDITKYDKSVWVDVFNKICKYFSIPYFRRRSIENIYLNYKNRTNFVLNNYYTFDNFNIHKKID